MSEATTPDNLVSLVYAPKHPPSVPFASSFRMSVRKSSWLPAGPRSVLFGRQATFWRLPGRTISHQHRARCLVLHLTRPCIPVRPPTWQSCGVSAARRWSTLGFPTHRPSLSVHFQARIAAGHRPAPFEGRRSPPLERARAPHRQPSAVSRGQWQRC
jgi:hypothetical protein